MTTKAYTARVICDNATRAKLWQLTETFNDRVRFVLLKMLDMRAGRAGPELKAVFDAIGSSQNSFAKMEAIAQKQWNTRKLDSADAAAFSQIAPILDATIEGIGGWIDTHPMEWRQHLFSDPSPLRWRRADSVFADFTPKDLERIEKSRSPSPTRKKPSRAQARKKRADWRAIAAAILLRNNEELKALDKTRRESRWAEMAQIVRARPDRFLDEERDLARLGKEFKRKVYEGAFAIIDSHNEKLKDWRTRHAGWLRDKQEFEEDNKSYMRVRCQFAQFEREVCGTAGKRRRRWHRYLAFLRAHPDLAAWRGKPPIIQPIPPDALQRSRKAPRRRRSSVEAEEFFRANPELKALDEIHGEYEEKYVRRDANRRFLDGFSLPPTLTLPQIALHPCWYTFKKNASYKDLCWDRRGKVARGTVRIMLPFEQDRRQYEWLNVGFRGTPRLLALRRASSEGIVTEGTGRSAKKFTWEYDDPHRREGEARPAEVKGIKLLFRPPRRSGTPYLVFTVALADKGLSEEARALKSSSGRVWEGMVSCAADLVMRHPHLAAVSIAVATKDGDGAFLPRIVRTGFVTASETEVTGKHEGRLSRGPSLKHQTIHKQRLRSLRKGSRAVKGSTRNRRLQQHVTNMGEDACRKAARKLVEFALKAYCHAPAEVLVVENLKALRADARRERGLNTGLINWRRGHTTKWTKLFAESDGLVFREENPYWTSQVCSRCLRLGRRYTPCRDEQTGILKPRFGTVEKLFACPTSGCQIDVNADLNASINLHHVLYRRFPRIRKSGDAILIDGRRTTYAKIEREVLARLQAEARWLRCPEGRDPGDWRRALESIF